MSEVRRYQQLRAHLSCLELDNAAEALPRVPDEIRHENLSMTAALERLLEIEVNATEERRLAGRLRFACLIPGRCRTSTSPPSPVSTRN
ncbi:hypothetical protein [Kutzneria buriramensis]|uniref:hypothetical protein n=1 Tax=Kutzneria buriramensis TaxID=1045776 RepID=UPI001B86BD4D|nr:hypothetical protein [Kutzneria buriramensis]